MYMFIYIYLYIKLAGNFDMGTEMQQKKYVAHALDYRNAAISLLHYIENSKNLHDENGRVEGSEGEEARRMKMTAGGWGVKGGNRWIAILEDDIILTASPSRASWRIVSALLQAPADAVCVC